MKKCTLCGGKIDFKRGVCSDCGFRVKWMYFDSDKMTAENFRETPKNNTKPEQIKKPADNNKNKPANPLWKEYRKDASTKKSKLFGTIIGIVALLLTLGPPIIEMFKDDTVNEVAETDYDPYAYSDIMPEGNGNHVTHSLSPGFYIVGVHIEEGLYEMELPGEYDNLQLMDKNNNIFAYFSNIDGYNDFDLRLMDGALLIVSADTKVHIESTDAGEKPYSIENPNTDSYDLELDTPKVAGKDFIPGVYDIELANGDASLYLVKDDSDLEDAIYITSLYETTNSIYKNVIIPSGYRLYSEYAESGDDIVIKLMPSAEISSTDYEADYTKYILTNN